MAGEFPLQAPSWWRRVPLEEISEFITKGTTPTTLGFGWTNSGILFLRSECVGEHGFTLEGAQFVSPETHAALERSVIRPGDLLITITGNVGRVCLLPNVVTEANINQHIARIRIKPDVQADQAFVCYQLSHSLYRRHFERITTGLAYPQISLKQVREAIVALPPLPEQRKIVALLSSVDDTIEKTQAVVEQLEVVKKGLLGELLMRGMSGRHKAFQRTKYGQIPSSWDVVSLGEISNGKGQYGANVPKAPFDPELPRYVRITDIGFDGSLKPDDVASISEEAARPYILEEGDLLFARSGATVGKSFRYRSLYGRCAFAGYLVRFKLRREIVEPAYLHYFAQSSFYWDWVGGTQRALAQPNINASEYGSLLVPLPPRGEQEEIVAVLDSVNRSIEANRAELAALRKVKAGLLEGLLSGKVRASALE